MNNIVIFHVDTEPVHDVIEGKLHTIPPREPFEIDATIGHLILSHKWMHGIVEVATVRDRGGIRYDLETAEKQAENALADADERILNDYIRTQLEDRVQRNFPALPPVGRAAEVIARRRIDLASYGINPVGANSVKNAQRNQSEIEALRAENAELHRRLDDIVNRLAMLPAQPALIESKPAAPRTR